jgi:Flp pilus assembly protein TadG
MDFGGLQVFTRTARGVTFVWAPMGIIVLAGILSFAVDLGRVQSAKTQLQMVADAAARYAAQGIGDGTYLTKAQAAALANVVDGQPLTLSSGDVQLGVWDTATRTFTATASNPNAVRVVAKRHGANGIPTTLLGISANQRINVTAEAIVTAPSGPQPIVIYDFMTGSGSTVYDVSGFSPAMNLTMQHPSRVQWLSGGGIQINQATKLYTTTSTSRVRDAIAASGECTIFAYFRPANTSQGGPARVVTYSLNTSNRNFTLGQEGNRMSGRLRTSNTDANGMSPELHSSTLLQANVDTRAVLAYDGSVRGLGVKRGSTISTVYSNTTGNLNIWNNSWKIMLGNEDTNDRPYLGRIYRVEIYDQALTEEQYLTLLNGGSLSGGGSGGVVTVR